MLTIRKTLSMVVVVCVLSAIFPVFALAAAQHDINSSPITISASGDYIITGTGTPTTNTIRVEAGVNANITLEDVKIDVSGTTGACAFHIADNSVGNVSISLIGDNVLSSGGACAGLQKNGGNTNVGTLTISGPGSLTANGGPSGAGIGGGFLGGVASNIIIDGGTVTANGGDRGAGIGGGNNLMGGSGAGKNITINDGYVTAIGGGEGAGIGGGNRGSGRSITINGGTVTATGGESSAGIGGGDAGIYAGDWLDNSDITFNGGTVTANGGSNGAGIGGGWGGNGSNIVIGGDTITAIGGQNGPGVGGGYEGVGSDIKIKPAAGKRVTVRAGSSADEALELPGSPFDSETAYTGTHHYLYAEAIPAPEPPGEPVITAASASYNSIKLSWGEVSSASGYEVYRATASDGAYTRIVILTGGSTVTYTSTGLTTGTTYYYKVRAYRTVNSDNVYGGFSAVKSAVPTLSAATLLSAASDSYNSVKLTWGTVAGASGYDIYRSSSNSGTYTKIATVTGSSTVTYTNSGLATGTTYYYKMRAYRTVSTGNVYGGFSAVKSAIPKLSTPKHLTAAPASYNSVKLTWGAVAGVTKYKIYRSTTQTGTYTLLSETAALIYTNIGVNTGTTYYYKVKAYRLVGTTQVYSDSSAIVSAKTSLGVPASVKAVRASSSSITISWGAVTGATQYEVWRCTTSYAGTYSLLMTTATSYYTNTSLVTGKTYWYKVRAYRMVGITKVYSNYSSVVYAKP